MRLDQHVTAAAAIMVVSCSNFSRFDGGHAELDAEAEVGFIATCSVCDAGSTCGVCSVGYACSTSGACCTSTLGDVRTGDFTITFVITTRATQQSTVASQRASCDGTYPFWDISMFGSGTLVVETDGDLYCMLPTTRAVNDGAPHRVVVRRSSLDLSVTIDGVPQGAMPCATSLGSLPALAVMSGNPCEMPGGRAPLSGSVKALCMQGL